MKSAYTNRDENAMLFQLEKMGNRNVINVKRSEV